MMKFYGLFGGEFRGNMESDEKTTTHENKQTGLHMNMNYYYINIKWNF